jgi:hypothetical protein
MSRAGEILEVMAEEITGRPVDALASFVTWDDGRRRLDGMAKGRRWDIDREQRRWEKDNAADLARYVTRRNWQRWCEQNPERAKQAARRWVPDHLEVEKTLFNLMTDREVGLAGQQGFARWLAELLKAWPKHGSSLAEMLAPGMSCAQTSTLLRGAEIAGWLARIEYRPSKLQRAMPMPFSDGCLDAWDWRLACEGHAMCRPVREFVEAALGSKPSPCVECSWVKTNLGVDANEATPEAP